MQDRCQPLGILLTSTGYRSGNPHLQLLSGQGPSCRHYRAPPMSPAFPQARNESQHMPATHLDPILKSF